MGRAKLGKKQSKGYEMTEEEKVAWIEYFSCVVGWTFHPGYYRENATKPTLEQCADVADEMLTIQRRRFNQ